MKNPKIPYFLNDKPLFGLDIGPSSLKVMQIISPTKNKKKELQIIGYGFTNFDRDVIEDGVITNAEKIAESAYKLFQNNLIGNITTKRVAVAIPAYRTFTRSISLPNLQKKEIASAVRLEAEQYVSLPLDELYLDFEIIKKTKNSIDVFLVAVPKNIVDSYLKLTEILGLETVLIEPTLSSSGRLFSLDPQNDLATVIIDFGSRSADISIFDKHVLVTGTVQAGGEIFTNTIKNTLGITLAEAGLIKTKYGLSVSKKQTIIKDSLEPILNEVIKEIKRMMRYYEERYGNSRPIGQIVVLGGGANMPGLSDYLTNSIRLAVRHTDPWQYMSFKGLQPPNTADKPMYATVAGLALTNPQETF